MNFMFASFSSKRLFFHAFFYVVVLLDDFFAIIFCVGKSIFVWFLLLLISVNIFNQFPRDL